jgi:hypothetical protein
VTLDIAAHPELPLVFLTAFAVLAFLASLLLILRRDRVVLRMTPLLRA